MLEIVQKCVPSRTSARLTRNANEYYTTFIRNQGMIGGLDSREAER